MSGILIARLKEDNKELIRLLNEVETERDELKAKMEKGTRVLVEWVEYFGYAIDADTGRMANATLILDDGVGL